ncbi:MAG: phage Gp37/Gp68 family protein, partial [Chloroflexi bacterium]|nr:phage Gp37/Gp68 family protein [Chloroflexota bacterium]
TNATWNPVTGCTKVSPGCKHCYAERLAWRLQMMGQVKYRYGFAVTQHHDVLSLPRKWKRSRFVFVNSMSDLFHEEVPFSFIEKVFDVMVTSSNHTFQILTKRSKRLAELAPDLPWPSNVWAGVTVENADYVWRIADLLKVPATVRFLSLEPLLGPIQNLPLEGIHWVAVGGESGPLARPMDPAWVRQIRDQCLRTGVAFFFKQWGGPKRKAQGRILDGRLWNDMPAGLVPEIGQFALV